MALAVAQVLKKNNYSVDLTHDGESGLDLALSGVYDIVILDIMLPKMSGINVLRQMRKQGIETPVILLTAKGETEDKVAGLDSGADDYLAKAEMVTFDGDTPFNLSRACETACASMEALLYESGVSLETKITDNCIIAADGEKITQVLYILLDNAGKFTPRDGHIVFSLDTEQDRAVVRVSNTGEGIAPEDFSKIFDRFYRPDTSRSQETGGFGLGLSIAKTIVERSGGEISVECSGDMTTFTVRLKRI